MKPNYNQVTDMENKKIQSSDTGQKVNPEEFQMERDADIKEHLITGKQVWWKKIIEWVLTIIGWCVMISFVGYLGYGYLALYYGWYIPNLFVYNQEMLYVLKDYFFILFVATLVITVVLIGWKNYNRLRFGRKNRRKFRAPVSNEELAERFEVDLGVIEILQNERHVELSSNIVPDELGMGGRENKKENPATSKNPSEKNQNQPAENK